MREIRFRAWCEGKHKGVEFLEPRMEYDVTVQNGGYANLFGGWDLSGSIPTVPLMQFTGLKDKNGAEIYEGDIISSTYEDGVLFEVIYEGAGFWGKAKGGRFGLTMLLYSSTHRHAEGEVIGNIHQHPHLLNAD